MMAAYRRGITKNEDRGRWGAPALSAYPYKYDHPPRKEELGP
jgi:hypothetical protein